MKTRTWFPVVLAVVAPVSFVSCGSKDEAGSPIPAPEGVSGNSTGVVGSVNGMRQDCGRSVWRRTLGSVAGFDDAPRLTSEADIWRQPEFSISVDTNLLNIGATQMDPESKAPVCQAVREFFSPGIAKWNSGETNALGLRRGDLFHFDAIFNLSFPDPLPQKLSDLSSDQLEGKTPVTLRNVKATFRPGLARTEGPFQRSVVDVTDATTLDFECEKPFQYQYRMSLRDLDASHVRAKDFCRDSASSNETKECLRVSVIPGDKCWFRAKNAVFLKADATRVRATIGGTLERSGENAYVVTVTKVELP